MPWTWRRTGSEGSSARSGSTWTLPAFGRPRSPCFEIVKDEDDLSRWRCAWDANLRLGRALFGPELLGDPNLHFVAGYDGERPVCGCLVNRTDDVLGISNVFAHGEARGCLAAAVSYVSYILDRLKPSGLMG